MTRHQQAIDEIEQVEMARAKLAGLPDGTYALADIATRWPSLLPSAMVLCGEALAQPRTTTFHSTSGVVKLDRTPTRDLVEHRRGEDILFRIRAGAPPTVSMSRPFRKGE